MCHRILFRAAAIGALGAAILFPRPATAADEKFDAAAVVACATDPGFAVAEQLDEPYSTFFEAAVWVDCLNTAAVAEEGVVDEDLDDASRLEKGALKRRRKSLRQLRVATRTISDLAATLADSDSHRDGSFGVTGYERKIRKLLINSTELRFLCLESFRNAWQDALAGAQHRTADILEDIAEDLELLENTAGAEQTGHGKKALAAGALAAEVAVQMQDRFGQLDVPESELPAFAAPEDKAGRKRRKQFKGLANEYSKGLIVLARLFHKIQRRVEKAVKKAQQNPPPPTGDPVPSDFFQTVGQGDYFVTRYTKNGTMNAQIPESWEFSRVGFGLETVTSREQLWTRMQAIVAEAEGDFPGAFRELYEGAMALAGGRDLGGQFVEWDQVLSDDEAGLTAAVETRWLFSTPVLFADYDGYLGTKAFRDADGKTLVSITVGFFFEETPPLRGAFVDRVEPGEYQIYHVLRDGRLERERQIPVRKLRNDFITAFWDELVAEIRDLQPNLRTTFLDLSPDELVTLGHIEDVVAQCGHPGLPVYDFSQEPFHYLSYGYRCSESDEPPAVLLGSGANVYVGFERIGD